MIKTWRPKSREDELSRCWRFCYTIANNAATPFHQGSIVTACFAASTSAMSAYINLPVPLCRLPTLSSNVSFFSGTVAGDGASAMFPTSVVTTGIFSRPDQVRITVSFSGTPLTQFRPYIYRMNAYSGCRIMLDAGV